MASVDFNQCAHINTFKFIGIKVLGQSTAHIRLFDVCALGDHPLHVHSIDPFANFAAPDWVGVHKNRCEANDTSNTFTKSQDLQQ